MPILHRLLYLFWHMGKDTMHKLNFHLFLVLLVLSYFQSFSVLCSSHFPKDFQTANTSNSFNKIVRRNGIFFLKMHKAASSTVQNIILRQAELFGMKILFPKRGYGYSYPEYFPSTATDFIFDGGDIDNAFDVGCLHSRFQNENVAKIFPHERVKYVSIIRDPVEHFVSVFHYFHSLPIFRTFQSLEDFFENAANLRRENDLTSYSSGQAKNGIAFDFGLNNSAEHVTTAELHLISSSFDLVLITEYVLESLILLKDLMGWDLQALVHFKLNSLDKKKVLQLDDTLIKKVQDWNSLDVQIYDFFNQTFWTKVKSFGHGRMEKEKSILLDLCAQATSLCLPIDNPELHVSQDVHTVLQIPPFDSFNETTRYRRHFHPKGVKIIFHSLKSGLTGNKFNFCERITAGELNYLDHLKWKQHQQ
mmetsp:Transcript_31029/g.40991  ORF Transcript_31029/g.40991 Transcript_31029/m.40991 type:complete len:419 (+) Transcript_31029:41-1297(+)